ncbi:hypothetical protein CMUS01_08798 [Colletotrichum musicola]|uniref:Uncharacterized protein n=1 Tax=Colletotrichum musicola TaxID=2175873 RepID=A0A8H6NCV4_9PEZI|nr:hypothetical protein CMUS01_08798 [Colletotrichum musicola]
MSVVVDPCTHCHYPRCSRCRVERLQTRHHQQTPLDYCHHPAHSGT